MNLNSLIELLKVIKNKDYISNYGILLKNSQGNIIFEDGEKEGEYFTFETKKEILKVFFKTNIDKEIINIFLLHFIREINEYEERLQELTILQKVAEDINSTLKLKDLLNLIMNLTKDALNSEACSLMILDEKSNELTFEIALGEKGDLIKEFRIPVGEGIAGWVAMTGQSLIVNDVNKDERFAKKYDSATSFVTKSIICVPLRTKEKIIGVIEVLNKIGFEGFDNGDLSLLQAIANQAAIAIENAKLYQNLKDLFFDTVESLASAIDAKDPYTHGHSRRVAKYAEMIAREMGYDNDFIEKIRLSALLHDIGKIGIDESILRKKGLLSLEERKEIEKHPVVGKKILDPLSSLQDIIPGVEEHHERFDGKGYPKGISGEGISMLGRIIAVADTLDAMTSDRPYRKGLSIESALEEIEKQKGKQFDPDVVSALLSLYKKEKLCSGS